MKTIRCPNPKCKAEFPDSGEDILYCPFCNEEIDLHEDDYYDYDYEPNGNKSKQFLFLAGGIVAALFVVALLFIFASDKKPPSPTPTISDLEAELTQSPTPTPEPSVEPSLTPSLKSIFFSL